MKAKFNSPVRIFSSIATRHFLATIVLVGISIALTNYFFSNEKNRK